MASSVHQRATGLLSPLRRDRGRYYDRVLMRLEITTKHGLGFVDLDRARGAPAALLVLTHGAGGGVETADLLAIRDTAVASGMAVARVTQPYRVAGRRSPAAPARQDAAWLEMLAAIRKRRGLGAVPMFVGGRSNGARVACRTAVASGAAGVVALAFPLHPPSKPGLTRLGELEAAGVPTLVVQGDRDPFGRPPAGDDRRIVVIPGDGHSLKRDAHAVAASVLVFLAGLIDGS